MLVSIRPKADALRMGADDAWAQFHYKNCGNAFN